MTSPSKRRATVNKYEHDPSLSHPETRHGSVEAVAVLPRFVGGVSIDGVLQGSASSTEVLAANQGVIHRIDQFVEGLHNNAESRLHAHQVDVMLDLADFVRNPSLDERGNPETWGFVRLPTGSGKTVVFSTLAGVLSRRIEGERTPKGLVLVPKLGLVTQTKGENSKKGKKRGLAAFAPEVPVTTYTGESKSLEGDVVVMTYQSFPGAVKSGKVTEGMFDYIFCDEVHRALGPKRIQSLEKIAGSTPIIGFTATTDFKRKSVGEMFPVEIHSVELREAVELGWLSPVRAIAIDTKVELGAVRGGKDFKDDELEALIVNEWRNNKAIEFARDFIADGQQGIISCVPGNNLAHARMIANQLAETDVVDKVTGEVRKIRAVVVDGEMDDGTRDKIYKDYELGLIDVIAYVDLLTEGWDSDKAQFLINLRPTTSPVNAVQRLGRILRRVDGKIATIVEFIDRSERPIYTFWHAMGEEEIRQGKVYSSEESDESSEAQDDRQSKPSVDMRFSEELAELISEVDHIAVKDLIVERQSVKSATADDLLLRDVLSQHRMSKKFFKRILDALQDEGITIEIYTRLFNGTARPAISRESYESIQHIMDQHCTYLPEDAVLLARIRDKFNLSFDAMMKIMQGLPEVTLGEQRMVHGYSDRPAVLAYYVHSYDVERIEAACEAFLQDRDDNLKKQGLVEPKGSYDVAIKDAHLAIGISKKQLDTFIDSLSAEERPRVCVDTTNPGRMFKYYKIEDMARLLGAYIRSAKNIDSLMMDGYIIRNQIATKFPNQKDNPSYAQIIEFSLGIRKLKKLLIAVKNGDTVVYRVPKLFMREFCDVFVEERKKVI